MTKEITRLTLENEMDLIVAYKRMTSIAEGLKLTTITQTALATAIVEIGREVIDKTNTAVLVISILHNANRYTLYVKTSFDVDTNIQETDEGFSYAKKLVAECNYHRNKNEAYVEMQLNIPSYTKLNKEIIEKLINHFKHNATLTPYEDLKEKNFLLQQVKAAQEEEIRQSAFSNKQKNEFISIASHELKTPITTIKAYSQLALDSDNFDIVKLFLKKINLQSDKLNTLIHQLLDITKMESGRLAYNKESINFNLFIREIIPSLSYIYPSHKININSHETEVHVYIDKLRIEQVITNLLNNASKYSSPNTNINIHFLVNKEDMIQFAISDEGIGIDEDSLDNIFNKFHREEEVINNYSGFGIGLYISKNIVEEHNGTIWAQSTKGKGTTFIFTLPIIKTEM